MTAARCAVCTLQLRSEDRAVLDQCVSARRPWPLEGDYGWRARHVFLAVTTVAGTATCAEHVDEARALSAPTPA